MCLKTDKILLQCTFYQFQYFITTCKNIENRKSFYYMKNENISLTRTKWYIRDPTFFQVVFQSWILWDYFMGVYSQNVNLSSLSDNIFMNTSCWNISNH